MTIDRLANVLSMFQDKLTAGMPLLTRLKFDLEKDAAICETNRNVGIENMIGDGAVKILVDVGGTKLLLMLILASAHSASFNEMF